MDILTLYLVLFGVLFVQAITLYRAASLNREETGINDWALSALMFGISMAMIALIIALPHIFDRKILRDLFVGMSNSVSMAGYILLWTGLRRFYKKTVISYSVLLQLALLFFLVTSMATATPYAPDWRVISSTIAIVIVIGLIVSELLGGSSTGNPAVRMIIGALAVLFLAILSRPLLMYGGSLNFVEANTLASKILSASSILVCIVLTPSIILLTNERISERLRELAIKDSLTGILNRRAFFEYAERYIADLNRHAVTMAVCLIDLDHFKQVNDNHGHAMGDQILSRFADLARSFIRETDLFGRYGGEEFAFIFRNSTKEQAAEIIERLRFACNRIQPGAGSGGIEFSAGLCDVSGPDPEARIDRLLDLADQALYQAKRDGRNRVVLAEPLPVSSMSLT
ncbi:MAG: GGDEF domain-containing protein [Gammaproteobacteria bacterium]|nr:GGDEF domain-containing protein [Gammaproteobacteria bacterium]